MADKVIDFEPTELEEIPRSLALLRTTFRAGRTKDLEFRRVQLRKLYWAITENEKLIEGAVMADLHKSKYEAAMSEIDWAKNEIMDHLTHLDKWAKDEKVPDVPFAFKAMNHRVRYEPLGVILVIGSYNMPFQLNLSAAIGAIGAGNCVVLKPSESAPKSAAVLKKLFDDALDPECYVCVNGAIEQTTALLGEKFDKIAFTGGKGVGKIVAQRAAETLTPVLLELGGLNPAFITKNADVKLAARRLLWHKVLNAGQICLSHNYILVDRSKVSPLIAALNGALRAFMPKGAKNSPDFGRIVNKRHFDRIKKMLDTTSGSIVMGGKTDEAELFIEPTAVLVSSIEDSMMVEESFGPIFCILPYDTLDEAIAIANQVDPTPLGLYSFGSDAENKKVLDNVTSGGATTNDGFFHCATTAAPIGGVGQSGTGMYHGVYSFKAFSHQRAIAHTPGWADALLRARYMPYNFSHLNRLHKLDAAPDFDRNGRQIKGLKYLVGLVLGLGGKSGSQALARWAAVLAVVFAVIGQKQGYAELLNKVLRRA